MKKNKKEIEVDKMCIKYNFSCKRCPKNSECEEELKRKEGNK